jgi:hypothetical protein
MGVADPVSARLKQIDSDGTTRLTDPVTVARSGPVREQRSEATLDTGRQ